MRTLADVIQTLGVQPDHGMTDAAVEASRQRFGRNVLTPLPREPAWKKFLEKFDEPIIKILLAAALLSILVDLFKPPVQTARFVAGGVGVALSLLTLAWAYFTSRGHWAPAILFVTALLIWPVGLA